jgi:glycosyltransferase involved in cell wall biosynthesis
VRIWFIKIGEPLPVEREARVYRYNGFTKALARRGHDVTWWTASFSHTVKRAVAPPDSMEIVDGVRVEMLGAPEYRRNVSVRRYLHHLVFARKLRARFDSETAPDVIVCSFPTVEACAVAVEYGARHRVPVMLDVRDEWPDEYVRLLPRALRRVGRWVLEPEFRRTARVFRAATAITGVSERQVEYGLAFAKRSATWMDKVFYLGYQPRTVDPAAVAAARERLFARGVRREAFVVTFGGTAGISRPIAPIIDAVRALRPELAIQLVLAGGGDDMRAYREQAADLPDVIFPGWLNAAELAALLDMTSVAIAPYHPDSAMSFPLKFFDYMAAAVPIVTSCGGEVRELFTARESGLFYEAFDVEGLVRVLRRLHADSGLRDALGRNARALLEERYTFERLFPEMEAHLHAVVQANAPESR